MNQWKDSELFGGCKVLVCMVGCIEWYLFAYKIGLGNDPSCGITLRWYGEHEMYDETESFKKFIHLEKGPYNRTRMKYVLSQLVSYCTAYKEDIDNGLDPEYVLQTES